MFSINIKKELLIPSLAIFLSLIAYVNEYVSSIEMIVFLAAMYYSIRGVENGIAFLFPWFEQYHDKFFRTWSLLISAVMILALLFYHLSIVGIHSSTTEEYSDSLHKEFDYIEAKKYGYSDEEISLELKRRGVDMNVSKASMYGYTQYEISAEIERRFKKTKAE